MELLDINNKTMSSREIAELTGKEHRNVLADCDNLNENYRKLSLAEISAGVYFHKNTGNQKHREYLLTRMQTFDLMTGYKTDLRIKVNRRWEELEKRNAIDFTNPETILQLAQNWRDEHLKRIAAEQKSAALQESIEELTPKAEVYDEIADCTNLKTVAQVAKELNTGQNRFFEWLRFKRILMSGTKDTYNIPYQEYIDSKLFQLKTIPINGRQESYTKTYFTPRGELWITKIWKDNKPDSKAIPGGILKAKK